MVDTTLLVILSILMVASWITPAVFVYKLFDGLKKMLNGEDYTKEMKTAAICLAIPFGTIVLSFWII